MSEILEIDESSAFKKRIIDVLSSNTLSEAVIILNGEYLTSITNGKRKLVYVRVTHDKTDNTELAFYTKARETQGADSYSKEEPLVHMFGDIKSILLSDRLYGVRVPGVPSLTKCNVRVCPDNAFLILESQLYSSVKAVIASGKDNYSFRFGDITVELDIVRQLVDLFKENAYRTFGELIFSPYSRKLLNKLRNRGKFFYGIQNSFIPVIIDYDKVYNPFKNNPIVEKTKLYQVAVEKNRCREMDGVSCYYLTQYEVCKALGMSRFMRFTPSFLYQVFVGLLFPNNTAFPSVNRAVYVANTETGKRVMNESNYVKAVQSAMKVLDNPESSEFDRKFATDKLNDLNAYEKQSSLLVACQRNQKALSDVGGPGLDHDREKTKSAIAYFNYLKEAKAF